MTSQPEPKSDKTSTREHSLRLVVVLVVGAGVGVVTALTWRPLFAPLVGWAVACLVYLVWVWAVIWGMSAHATATHAVREDPGRRVVDVLLLFCAVSLQVDLVVVLAASRGSGTESRWIALLGLASVILSWALAQTLFTLRYAHLFHVNERRAEKRAEARAAHPSVANDPTADKLEADLAPFGGIDFNRPNYRPRYQDFAYFSFNLGMTFQVSDTTVSDPAIRVTVLRHTLLSYMFTTLVLANVINVIVGILP
ncbi:MAG: DUF1345 domain-containing protein [Propionibacteriaceae bacterium]|nr:DUF1345 domain-containing protein [Propionibacteriaceae bacterium]